jgi:DNA-binding transcriptional MerR regulator
LHLIDNAQTLGFSLSEIKVVLTQASGNPLSRHNVLKALRQKLTSLDAHIDE